VRNDKKGQKEEKTSTQNESASENAKEMKNNYRTMRSKPLSSRKRCVTSGPKDKPTPRFEGARPCADHQCGEMTVSEQQTSRKEVQPGARSKQPAASRGQPTANIQ
jgi:hypothetical protein